MLASFLFSLCVLAQAQPNSPQKQPAPPTKRAANEVRVLQEKLNLTQDQVLKCNVLILNRSILVDSLKANPSGNRRSDRQSLKAALQDTDQQINAQLTDDQKKLYQQWKEEKKERRREKKFKTDSTVTPNVQ
jgi:hypothetical protein